MSLLLDVNCCKVVQLNIQNSQSSAATDLRRDISVFRSLYLNAMKELLKFGQQLPKLS